ncbi:hypothetical protein HY477_02855 [Candidatus Uhrbacteria bacterium]|nr:hypothetical protein [Candidatus Uhrbacteria bacterium]
MPKHFHLTKVHHTMRRVGIFVRLLSSKKSWRALLVVGIAAVGFSYLVTVVSISTHGYKIKDLERSIEDLKLENKKLNLKSAEMRAPQRIEEWVRESGMVAASNVQYVSAATGVVAAR